VPFLCPATMRILTPTLVAFQGLVNLPWYVQWQIPDLILKPSPQQWSYDSATGVLSPHWVNGDGCTFPAVPLITDRSDWCSALPTVQSFVSGTGFFVGGDENAFNAKYLNSASLVVSVRFLSRHAVADSFSRASNLSDYEPPQSALVTDTY
jgi:hypothetical protein